MGAARSTSNATARFEAGPHSLPGSLNPAAPVAPVIGAPIAGVALGAVEAGVRYADRRDLVALHFSAGTRVAGVFTRNAFRAAPVQVAQEHLEACGGQPRVLLINTGNANAGTGAGGLAAARTCCDAAARLAGCLPEEVLPFSTGVIGEDLPTERIVKALPGLLENLDSGAWDDASWGILTTDTQPKLASRVFEVAGNTYTITGMAKGAGMLRPNMATMLAYVATDLAAEGALLKTLLTETVEQSFHRITVDGDTSTNDAVILAATGAANNPMLADAASDLAVVFRRELSSLMIELAKGLVRDGEGASKFVEVRVSGGVSADECLDVAFTIAHSPLVKTALFAGDPNWGRLLAAIGRAGIGDFDANRVRVRIGEHLIAEGGARADTYNEAAVGKAMDETDIVLRIDLGRGEATETVWTSDLSYDYVRINAEYRS